VSTVTRPRTYRLILAVAAVNVRNRINLATRQMAGMDRS
jgi:hypothetical protein